MKRLIASFLLLTRLATAQSWGPMFDQQNTMLNTLSTDAYITLPGNLTSVLGLALKQQVRNTVATNLHEVWVGTPDGNRLLTMRGGTYTASIGGSNLVAIIPHNLGYVPTVYMAHVISPINTTNPTISVSATTMTVTFVSGPLSPTPYLINYLLR